MAARTAARTAALRAAIARVAGGAGAPMANESARGPAAAALRPYARPYQRAGGANAAAPLLAAGLAVAAAWRSGSAAQSEQSPAAESGSSESESGYKENPIQNVTALLRLYEEIDKNMAVLAGRMLEDLERRLADEKRDADASAGANAGAALSPEQRALDMSIRFESTLEKVQDAVFRNHYVSKEQVREALARLTRGELRGAGPAGAVSVAEADAIAEYVRKLGRMRWLCTGSREPIIPTETARMVPDEQPELGVDAVVGVMTELIPALTREMEALVGELRAQSPPLERAAWHRELSRRYIARSGELTAQVCAARRVDVREFQRALLFFHDDPALAQALAALSAAQQQRFRELGVY